jgi:hypothetical protein
MEKGTPMNVMRKTAWALALLLCCLSSASVLAAAPAASAASAASPHEQAARELYAMIGGRDMAKQAGNAMVAQMASNPALAPYQDVLMSWVQKVFAGGTLDAEMIRLYVATFSESELRQLIAFYQTPIGQKALQKMPELMQKGMAIGQKLAQDHMPELQSAIAARKRELDKGQKKP